MSRLIWGLTSGQSANCKCSFGLPWALDKLTHLKRRKKRLGLWHTLCTIPEWENRFEPNFVLRSSLYCVKAQIKESKTVLVACKFFGAPWMVWSSNCTAPQNVNKLFTGRQRIFLKWILCHQQIEFSKIGSGKCITFQKLWVIWTNAKIVLKILALCLDRTEFSLEQKWLKLTGLPFSFYNQVEVIWGNLSKEKACFVLNYASGKIRRLKKFLLGHF